MMVSSPGWLLRRTAALLVAALFLLPGSPARAADTLAVINQIATDQFPTVAVYLTVVDAAGLPVTDLTRDRVTVAHNGGAIPDFTIDLVDTQQDGLAIVVAVDTSGSMQGPPLDAARNAVRLLLAQMGPHDRGALLSFGQTVQVVQDLTDDRAALERAIDSLTAQGDTALYDGAAEAIGMAARNPLGRRAVVVLTDGEDTHSRRSLDEVVTSARETNTPVSVIGFGQVMVEPLQQLTATTGGLLSIAPDADRLAEQAGRTAELLRKQYVLRYRAPDSRPPENEVEVTVTHGDGPVRTAQRFPAPPMPPLGISLPGVAPDVPVRGLVELRPHVENAARVDSVEYLLDGASLGTVTEPPYTFRWDTTTVPPGPHTLTIRARLGEQEAQEDVPLMVAPPVGVRIILPAGPEVAGAVRLTAEIAEGAAVQAVSWAVDGQPVGEAQQPPFELTWDSSAVPPGDHTITAEARDAGGVVGRASQAIRVLQVGASPSPSPSPSPVGATGTPGAGTAATGTRTPAPTRTPTGTPATTEEEGPGGISWPIWIGGAVVLGLVVAIVVATTRRRPDATVVTASSTPYQEPEVPPHGQQPPAPPGGFALPPAGDLREADTAMVSALPTAAGPNMGMPGRSTITVHVVGAPPRPYPLGLDHFVGRAPGESVIQVIDPLVSRRHARISWEDGKFLYRDLGPMNPTRRDGRTLPNPYALRDGDRLRLGTSELVFRA